VLVQELKDDDNWALQYYTAQDSKVTFLFFTRDEMIKITQANPSVMIMDATYRTNKLNMPAIYFQAITLIGKTASIALAFIINEEEPLYLLACRAFRELIMGDARIKVFLTDDETALKNALKAIYPTIPQLLCLWHINKNVLIKA